VAHPVVQGRVLINRCDTDKEDREQDPAEGITRPADGQQGAHGRLGHHDRHGNQRVSDRASGTGLMDQAVERHAGQPGPEVEQAERHCGNGRRP
jgi:hypothetical protein